jgi:hypothetical protein
MRTLVAAIVVAFLASACGAARSSADLQPSSPVASPRVTTACLDLDRSRCEAIEVALPGQIPAGRTPQNAEISESRCDGPCLPAGVFGWRAHVKVEFLDGGEPVFLDVEVTDAMKWEAVPTVSVWSVARTTPIVGSSIDIDFEPCGYDAGIDADASFWDPAGALTWDALRRLNSAHARFTLTSRQTATLTLDDGSTINLARHTGPKHLQRCD